MFFLYSSFFISCISFIFFVFLTKFMYKKITNNAFSFKKFFPYELKFNCVNSYIYLLIFYLLSILFGFFLAICFNKNFSSSFFLASLISHFLSSFFLFLLFLVPLNLLKEHLLIFSFSAIFSLFDTMFLFLGGFDLYKRNENMYYYLIFAVISIILFILIFVSLFYICFTSWSKLKKEYSNDGSLIYTRGKIFPLAFVEWIYIFINEIVLLIMLGYGLLI